MCEHREKRVLGEEAPAPTEGSGDRFPRTGITPGGVSRPPLHCAANLGTTKESGFSNQASMRYCPRKEQTLLLPFFPSPENIFFCCQNVFRGTAPCTSRGDHDPRMAASTC